MKVGLRIDVDTFRGTRLGAPHLCRLLAERRITATFFFSVGPDNMGRHLWRLLDPKFLAKMIRSRAPSLYGWDILLRGAFWPGPLIGRKLQSVIRAAAAAGHEVGLHAWDHHAWQQRLERMDDQAIAAHLQKAHAELTRILGRPPLCSAAPAWKCNRLVLLAKERFGFTYNSDCRGHGIFFPVLDGRRLAQPQVPVTLPTYDEVIGRGGVSDANYPDFLLSRLQPDHLNVLTVHAEVEGLARRRLFENFLRQAQMRAVTFVPLGELLPDPAEISTGGIAPRDIPGRAGWVACQTPPAPP